MGHTLQFPKQVGIYRLICSKQTWEVDRAMIIIPNSKIREMKAEGCTSNHCKTFLYPTLPYLLPLHELTNSLSHSGPKSLFLSSHLFTLIKPCSPVSSVLEFLKCSNRKLTSAWQNNHRERNTHRLSIYSFSPWKLCTYCMSEIPLDCGENSWTRDASTLLIGFSILRGHNHARVSFRGWREDQSLTLQESSDRRVKRLIVGIEEQNGGAGNRCTRSLPQPDQNYN